MSASLGYLWWDIWDPAGWTGERLEARVILGCAVIIITFIVIIFVIISAWFAEGCTPCIHLVPAVTTLGCTPGAQVFFFCVLFAVLCGQVGCRDKVSSPLHGLCPTPLLLHRFPKLFSRQNLSLFVFIYSFAIKWDPFQQFTVIVVQRWFYISSAQCGIHVLRKGHKGSTPSLRFGFSVVLETIPVLIWLVFGGPFLSFQESVVSTFIGS